MIYLLGTFLLAQIVGTLIHELGHGINSILTGGGLSRIEFSVFGWSRAILDPHGEARAVSWGGVQWSVVFALAAFLLCWIFRSRGLLFALVLAVDAFASGGQYLTVGLLTGKGDGAHLAMMGVERALIIGIAIPLILVVFPLTGLTGPLLGLGRRRSSYLSTLTIGLPLLALSLTMLGYNMLVRASEWRFWVGSCGSTIGLVLLFGSWVHVSAPWFDREEVRSRKEVIAKKRANSSLIVAVVAALVLSFVLPVSLVSKVHEAVQHDNMRRLEKLLGDIDVNGESLSDTYGRTPLHTSVTLRRTNIVDYLLLQGVHVDATNRFGRTPLHQASYLGEEHLAEVLIAAGADINAMSRSGTPLHASIYSGDTNFVAYLIAAGADTSATNMHGTTAADIAKRRGMVDLLPLLEQTP